MKCFGQVIETYNYGAKPWLTIWDLAKGEQVAVMDRHTPPLKLGQLVSFECQKNNVSDVKKIAKDQLPAGVKPLI